MPNCVSDATSYWNYQADPRSDGASIQSGLRMCSHYSCQYWLKGLPGQCVNWNSDSHTCGYDISSDTPTGYGNGFCDGIGRRSWCNRYDNEGNEDLNEYVCIAPCLERSGLGKPVEGATVPMFTAVPADEILGYNDGKCDGSGLGRGEDGEGASLDALLDMNRVCNYYRPYDMGFGFTEPQQIIRNSDGTINLEAMEEAVMDELNKRLPFNFKVYNLRAKCQKCAYWNQDSGAQFSVSTTHDGIILNVSFGVDGRIAECTCPDTAANPYRTRDLSDDALPILKNVWSSDAKTVVCNGAKPECPCYTGEWLYCNDEKMRSGMKITAEQIMELRFWMRDWPSQEEYDRFFEDRPNNSDPTTADIYTFERWEKLDAESPEDSLMVGKKIHMCMPAAPCRKEFDPDVYLEYEEVQYPPILTPISSIDGKDAGTTSESQVSFPSLIRDLSEYDPVVFEVVYPYFTKDPFGNFYGCGAVNNFVSPCVKRNCSIEDDSVSVIGYTVRNKDIYCYNASIVPYKPDLFWSYDSVAHYVLQNPENEDSVHHSISEHINTAKFMDVNGNSFSQSSSDSNGVFVVGPMQLEYQKLNYLIVIVDFNDGTYDFRRVPVWSQWQGGLAIQTEFKKEIEGGHYVDGEDLTLVPPGEISISLMPLEGANPVDIRTSTEGIIFLSSQDVMSTYSSYTNYNYCLKKTTLTIQEDNWMRVGNSGVIWVEISDTNLNYLLEWGVISAKMSTYKEDTLDGESTKSDSEEVDMDVILPNGSYSQVSIPRNVVVLSPSDGKARWFKASGDLQSKLNITYYYHHFSNDNNVDSNTTIVWPNFGSESNRFVSPAMYLSAGESTSDTEYLSGDIYKVENIQNFSPLIACLFKDEDDALVSAVATRPLINVPRVFSQNIETYYSWTATGSKYRLEPSTDWAEYIAGPTYIESINYSNIPPCGDHELTVVYQTGPMWYPFANCSNIHRYDVYAAPGYCTMPHEGTPRNDYRGCGPDQYYAYNLGDGTIAGCSNDFIYGYAVMGSSRFTGYCAVSPYINATYYEAMGWALPPFGNTSRPYVERFFSTHHVSYQSSTGAGIIFTSAWLPKVMDSSDLTTTFNSFGYGLNTGQFTEISQLSFMVSLSEPAETIGTSRLDFDDIFEIRTEPRVAYPGPLVEDDYYGTPFYCFYKFKDNATLWAWQEKWNGIERAAENPESMFYFASLSYPDYEFDMYKKEHRKTISEGYHTLKFIAPEVKDDGGYSGYPKIQLDDGPERSFKILYDNYDSSEIEWADEDEGEVGGSGGTEPNIYEMTSNRSEWCHTDNTLFEEGAFSNTADAETAGQMIKISYDSLTEVWNKTAYNRGLEVYITRDRLKYLPKQESSWPVNEITYNPPGILSPCSEETEEAWVNESRSCTLSFSEVGALHGMRLLCYVGVYVCKDIHTGVTNTTYLCVPNVEVRANGELLGTYYGKIPSKEEIRGRQLNLFQIEMFFSLNPDKMLNKTDSLDLTFTSAAGHKSMIVPSSFNFEKSEYVDASETIKTWERKYHKSTGFTGNFSPNGPNEELQPRFGFTNGGIYWPYWNSSETVIVAYDKMRSVFGGDFNTNKIYMSTSDILSSEEEYQKNLYDSAYNLEGRDYIAYRHYLPPKFRGFFSDIGGVYTSLATFICKSDKLPWDSHYLTSEYSQITKWQPLGHTFAWNPNEVMGMRCYFLGDRVRDIYRVGFVHKHPSGDNFEAYANRFEAFCGPARQGYISSKQIPL